MIADVIRHCFPIAAQAVADKAEEINKLNVFPVPDGDTGTNMSLTLKTVVTDVEALPKDADMAAVAKAITHGSLMGARGNSGVITSQILRGFAEGVVDCKDDPITTDDFAKAARNAKKVAFQAVRKPVEGTILTVVSDLSAKADECAKQKMDLDDALKAMVTTAYESVKRTPDLLPVLKENGVVDSGAFGFAVFFEAFVNAQPIVRECWMLSGEVDFILKCVASDMAAFQDFVTHLTAAPHVQNVRTSLVLHNSKYASAVPLELKVSQG